jgi:hypothetical protein
MKGSAVPEPNRLLNRDHWLAEIGATTRSEERGHPKAAVRRLSQLCRSLERRVAASIDTPAHRGLLHSLEAGIQSRAGMAREARDSYLHAATTAFGDAWAALSLITNSMWAAELEPRATRRRTSSRLRAIERLDDEGSRFLRAAGDLLNAQRLGAGLRPIIFGGKYPAKVAEPLTRRLLEAERKIRGGPLRRPTRRA